MLDYIPIIGDLIGLVKQIVPDRASQDQLIGKINETMAAAAARQSEITLAEVNSADKFKSRWRPAIGWVCASGLALHFIFVPVLSMALVALGQTAIGSPIDVQSLMTLVMTLLGLGGLRTVEKIKGAS